MPKVLTYGGWITFLVLLPNVLAIALPPRNVPSPKESPSVLGRIMQIAERVGQVAAFTIPFFYFVHITRTAHDAAVLVLMAVFLIVYYICWIRYAVKREYRFFFAPFAHVPIPMAVMPVLYYFLAAYVLGSPYLLAGTFVLAVGHVYVTLREYARVKQTFES
jgi:hypothetical protein